MKTASCIQAPWTARSSPGPPAITGLALLCLLSVLAGTPAYSAQAADLVSEGRSLLDQNEPVRAREVFEQALDIDPENSEIYYLLGRAYQQEGDTDSAIEVLNHFVRLNPEHIDARMLLASAYESRDRLDKAIEQYRAVTELTRPATGIYRHASKKLRYSIATLYARRGEIDEARILFEELADEYPRDALILYSAAVANLLSNRMAAARDAFEKVIDIDSEYVNAYLNLATVDESQGRMEEAVANLRRVIELDPESPAAAKAETRLHIIEGQLLIQEGIYREAAAAFERALKIEPSNRVALDALASLYRRLDDIPGELGIYEEIVNHYPGDDRAQMRLVQLYLLSEEIAPAYRQLDRVIARGEEGRFYAQAVELRNRLRNTEAGRRIEREKTFAEVEALRRHLENNPDDAESWKQLGMLNFRLDAYEDAVTAFENVLRMTPRDKQAREGLALLYDHLGRFSEAARQYAYLVSTETDEEVASKLVESLRLANAKNLYTRNRRQLAIREFNDILEQDPDNQIAHFYLGLIYSEEEDLLEAVNAYQEVVRIVPSHVGARMNLAFSYERLNREEDAIDEYRKILESDPSPEVAETAKRRLEDAQQRINGVSVSAGYVMGYDSNSNLSEEDPRDDFRSDLSLSLAYQYKMENDLRWRFLLSPTYTNYHKGQFDYLNTTLTVSASLMPGRYTLVGGYTHRASASLITESRLSRMHTLFAEASSRYRLPNLVAPFSGEWVFSNVSMNLSYSNFDSRSSPFFSSYTTSAGMGMNQRVSDRTRIRLGYSMVDNENKELVGSDYAYVSHGISIGGDRQMPWGSINANYGFTYYDYTNLDSFSQFTQKRKNYRHNLSAGANYQFTRDIRFFVTASWTDNNSNLPVGFILSREDIIEGLQSSSLSDYHRLLITTGMNMSF